MTIWPNLSNCGSPGPLTSSRTSMRYSTKRRWRSWPLWWSQGELLRAEVATMPARTTRRARPATAMQGTLFAEAQRLSPEASRLDWIEHLLTSPVFAAQRRVAGRRAPDDQCVRALLATLEAQHGR